VIHLSPVTARTTVTPQIIATILHGVSNVGVTTTPKSAPNPKPVQPSAPYAWVITGVIHLGE